jgi:hypothetical protein
VKECRSAGVEEGRSARAGMQQEVGQEGRSSRRQECRSEGVKELRSAGGQKGTSAGVHEFRRTVGDSLGGQECSKAGGQECRRAGVQ